MTATTSATRKDRYQIDIVLDWAGPNRKARISRSSEELLESVLTTLVGVANMMPVYHEDRDMLLVDYTAISSTKEKSDKKRIFYTIDVSYPGLSKDRARHQWDKWDRTDIDHATIEHWRKQGLLIKQFVRGSVTAEVLALSSIAAVPLLFLLLKMAMRVGTWHNGYIKGRLENQCLEQDVVKRRIENYERALKVQGIDFDVEQPKALENLQQLIEEEGIVLEDVSIRRLLS